MKPALFNANNSTYNDRTCCLTEKQLLVWHSVVVTLILINEVTLHWARLVLGWVTICRCRPTQPSVVREMS